VRYTEFVCKIVRVCVFYKVPIFIEKLSAVYRVILMVTNAFILRYYVCLFYLNLYPTILYLQQCVISIYMISRPLQLRVV